MVRPGSDAAKDALSHWSSNDSAALTRRWANLFHHLPPETIDHLARMPEPAILEGLRIGISLVSSADDAVTEFMGPWVGPKGAQEALRVSREALSKKRARRQILGVRFADNRFYYPAAQFDHGRVVEGLPQVLAELAAGVDDPDTWATWLAAADPDEPTRSMWQALRAGETDAVVLAAHRDAARWAA